MLSENLPIAPVPSKDQHETSSSTQEHSLGDVVESHPPLDSRLHADRVVRFDATAPLRTTSGVANERYDHQHQHHDADNDNYDGTAENAEDCASFLGQDRDESDHGDTSFIDERHAK